MLTPRKLMLCAVTTLSALAMLSTSAMATSVHDSATQAIAGKKVVKVKYVDGRTDAFEVDFVTFAQGQLIAIGGDWKSKVQIGHGKYPSVSWTDGAGERYLARFIRPAKYFTASGTKGQKPLMYGAVYGAEKTLLGRFSVEASSVKGDHAAGAWVGEAKLFGQSYLVAMKISSELSLIKGCSHGEMNGVFSLGGITRQRIVVERCDEEGSHPYSFSGFAFDDSTGQGYYLGLEFASKGDMLVGVAYVTNAKTKHTVEGPVVFKRAPTFKN